MLLHSLKKAARGFYVNSDKTKLMYFKQDGAMSRLNGKPLKLVHNFLYFGSNILSTESDVSKSIGKAWTVIDRILIIWKFDL